LEIGEQEFSDIRNALRKAKDVGDKRNRLAHSFTFLLNVEDDAPGVSGTHVAFLKVPPGKSRGMMMGETWSVDQLDGLIEEVSEVFDLVMSIAEYWEKREAEPTGHSVISEDSE
jgi:hypothetical protein